MGPGAGFPTLRRPAFGTARSTAGAYERPGIGYRDAARMGSPASPAAGGCGALAADGRVRRARDAGGRAGTPPAHRAVAYRAGLAGGDRSARRNRRGGAFGPRRPAPDNPRRRLAPPTRQLLHREAARNSLSKVVARTRQIGGRGSRDAPAARSCASIAQGSGL